MFIVKCVAENNRHGYRRKKDDKNTKKKVKKRKGHKPPKSIQEKQIVAMSVIVKHGAHREFVAITSKCLG